MRQIRYPSPRSPNFVKPKVTIENYNLSAGNATKSFKAFVRLIFVLTSLSLFFTVRLKHFVEFHGNITIRRNLKRTTSLRMPIIAYREQQEIQTNGTAVVAACQNGHQWLSNTVPSWMRLPNVVQVVLVDWTSTPALHYAVEELDRFPNIQVQLTVLRISNQTVWTASRAYNIAFRYVKTSRILSVDCSHTVRQSFLTQHDLNPSRFFTGSRHLARTSDEHHFNSVLYVHRAALDAVGGYDERVGVFGGHHDDLIRRLSLNGLTRADINYDTLTQNNIDGAEYRDSNTSKRYNQDVAEIEERTNLNLLSTCLQWNASSSEIAFKRDLSHNLTIPSFRHRQVIYVSFNLSQVHQAVEVSASISQITSYKKDVTTYFLEQRYRVPSCLTESLPLSQRLGVLRAFADSVSLGSARPRAIFVLATGDLPGRLSLLASARSLAEQTARKLIVFWPSVYTVPNKYTSFYALFASSNGMDVIENIDEQVLSNSSCPNNEIVNDSGFYSVFESDGNNIPIIYNEKLHHIIVRGDTMIRAHEIRYSNAKTTRNQLHRMLIHPSIEAKLQTLNVEQLSRAIGVYVPPISVSENRKDAFNFFTKVHQTIMSPSDGLDSSTPVFIYADRIFVQRLESLRVKVIPTLKMSYDCPQGIQRERCFVAEFTQILALTKTRYFFSPVDDQFTHFVRLHRGDEYPK